jgi:hypothetical protein
MKRLIGSAMMLAMLSVPALAAKNSQSVTVPETVKAGSAQLAPGNYDVSWTGTGPTVQVTFTLNKKVVATVPAKLVEQPNRNEGLETDSQGGVEVLHTILMKNMSLVLE